jgi:oligosaccharyltransferase complex subunit gamma
VSITVIKGARFIANAPHPDGVLAFAAIALAMKVPRIQDSKSQQIAVFAWGAILLGMYSFLLSVFRVKNGGYPFYLPPF